MTLASDAWGIARAGLRAVDPARAVRRTLRRSSAGLWVGRHRLPVGRADRLEFVALGKAAGAMVEAALTVAGRASRGIAFTPRGYPSPAGGTPVVFGNHPVPGADSFAAGRRLLEQVRATAPESTLVFLLSGGGSATVEVPAPGLGPDDLTRTTELLLASGAPIGAMNAIRRHLSAVKGGQLAVARGARRFATIAISDVVGDAPENIASGPTVGDPTTFRTALDAVRRYGLERRLPRAVRKRLRSGARGALTETPKPSDPALRRAPFVLAATNRTALGAAAAEARRRGYRTRTVPQPVVGETRPAAERFARGLLVDVRKSPGPVARVAGGETTVTLGSRPGRGGRNTEFAVAAARVLNGRGALVLSVGTDGVDGPTDAAGGWVDGASASHAAEAGIDLTRALATHATYDVLERLGGLLKPGPTGTNVMDLHVGLAVLAARKRARTLTWDLPGGLSVVPGTQHWELPARGGTVSARGLEWIARQRIGVRAIGRRPGVGRPFWDELLPLERRAVSPGTGGSSRPNAAPSSRRRRS